MPTLNTTTNNGFHYPTAANNGQDFATGIQDLATDLDALWSKGTLVSRRTAPATTGVEFFATDVDGGTTYKWNGSVWQTVMLAGAWTPISLPPGFATAASSYTPSARLEGDAVRLKGAMIKNSGASIGLGTLPAGTTPGQPLNLLGSDISQPSLPRPRRFRNSRRAEALSTRPL